MRHLLVLCRQFCSDERGAFAILFGAMGIVLVALAGAVVDFVSVEQARTRAQVALDSAALALQPKIFETPTPTAESLRLTAEKLLIERIGDASIGAKVDSATIDVTGGVLNLKASLTVPMNFVSLVGINQMQAGLMSEATRRRLNLEVAMVLDNSGSMSASSRMTNLIAAAKNATEILFDYKATQPNVFIGLVPFTMLVNVGPGNASAAWIDRTGTGPTAIGRDNFDDDNNDTTPFAGPIDRIALFDQLNGVSWGGCVEARRTPLDTNDTPPNALDPDTLFTPLFAPDEPSGMHNSYIPDAPLACPLVPTCTWVEVRTNCNSSNNSATCTGPTTNSVVLTSASGAVSTPASCPATAADNARVTASDNTTSTGKNNLRINTRTRIYNYPYSQRELQERICKYTGATPSGVSQSNAKGPNSDCPFNPITPLTNTKQTVIDAINAMSPQGGTNIHVGTVWGLRALSPDEPFTQGKAYDSATAKVMIVMTDGENTAYKSGNMNGSDYYSAYAFPYNERLGTLSWSDGQLEAEMNTRTLATCTNAKAAGITIYTIGLSTTVAANIAMLKACATTPAQAYFPATASELNGVFQSIALQLADLRLAK